MSDYSIVPNAALTATADAIRTKSGSQATIEFDHNTGFKDAVDAIPSGGGSGTKTYIVKDGKIQQGWSFTGLSPTVVSEETADGLDYVSGITPGNQYGAFITNTFNASLYDYLVAELVEIDNRYGYSWYGPNNAGMSIETGSETNKNITVNSGKTMFVASTGVFPRSSYYVGVPVLADTNDYIKIAITGIGNSTNQYGRINIKNLYLVKEA